MEDEINSGSSLPSPGPRRKSPPLAAFLSFLWPGLGQLYAGRRRQAAIFGLPALAVLLIVLYQARQGLSVLVARFVDPGFAMAALLIILALGALRIASVALAYVTVDRGASRSGKISRNGRAILGILIALIVVTHGVGGAFAYMDYSTFSQIFGGSPSDLVGEPASSATPPPDIYAGGSPPPASFGPTETQTPIPGRVTILLAGLDSYVTRTEHLYDSIMVVSLDETTNKVAMVSVPRDSAAFPLYFGGTVGPTTRINSLVSYIEHGWIKSPDAPLASFVNEIGYLVGIPIDYYAVMDLAGFMKMIDLVGGIDIVNPSAIDDPTYDWLDGVHHGFTLSAGPHHLDGKTALAYVRSRHGANNNDYKRESRQQQVMIALEHKMASPNMIVQLPTLMQTLGSSVRTNFPANQVADMVALGDQIPSSNITEIVLGPPYSDTGIAAAVGVSTSCLRLDKIATLSVQLFGDDSRYFGKKQADTCPAPLKATPKPTAKPTTAPAATPSS
ncbi:MAG: LCP family protein [Candidatus Limnocylindrales bacterium]